MFNMFCTYIYNILLDVIEDWNPIIKCSGCHLTVHRVCYGIPHAIYGDFYCDVCNDIYGNKTRVRTYHSSQLTEYPPCSLCGYVGGALRKLSDGNYVHLNCCLWINGIKINNFPEMKDIEIPQTLEVFISNPLKTTSYVTGSKIQYKFSDLTKFDVKESSTLPFINITKFPCIYCNSNKGLTLKCSYNGCRCTFHLYCAYFNGNYINITKNDNFISYIYAGGGIGHNFKIYCIEHTPKEFNTPMRQNEQIKLRKLNTDHPRRFSELTNDIPIVTKTRQSSRFSIFIQPSTPTPIPTPTPVHVPPTPSPHVVVKIIPLPPDIYPLNRCMCCLKCVIKESIIECKKCGITVHPSCYGITKNELLNYNNTQTWLCDICKSQSNINEVRCCLCPHINGAIKKTLENEYIHVFCALTHKHIQLKYTNNGLIIDTHLLQTKWRNTNTCVVCKQKYGRTIECNIDSCDKHFHPLCAFFQKIPIVYEGMEDSESKIVPTVYCQSHIPPLVKYINNRKCFISLYDEDEYTDLLKNWLSLKYAHPSLPENDKEISRLSSEYHSLINNSDKKISQLIKQIEDNKEITEKRLDEVKNGTIRLTIPKNNILELDSINDIKIKRKSKEIENNNKRTKTLISNV